MKRIVTGIGALLASAAPVLAGGIERRQRFAFGQLRLFAQPLQLALLARMSLDLQPLAEELPVAPPARAGLALQGRERSAKARQVERSQQQP